MTKDWVMTERKSQGVVASKNLAVGVYGFSPELNEYIAATAMFHAGQLTEEDLQNFGKRGNLHVQQVFARKS